jgi:hypothetical protein
MGVGYEVGGWGWGGATSERAVVKRAMAVLGECKEAM